MYARRQISFKNIQSDCGGFMLMYGKTNTILKSNQPPIKINKFIFKNIQGFDSDSEGKEFACSAGDQDLIPQIGKSTWGKEWQGTPVFVPGEFFHIAIIRTQFVGFLKSMQHIKIASFICLLNYSNPLKYTLY